MNPYAPLDLLLLGGTQEARRLGELLAGHPGLRATISLAGVTTHPRAQPVATRHGGFGGVDGLCRYLRTQAVDLVVDASHPFAARMSAHARTACTATQIPLWRLARPPWQPETGDRWISVPDSETAAKRLADLGDRVFLSVGARSLAPFAAVRDKQWLIRSIEPVGRPRWPRPDTVFLEERPPFTEAHEIALLRRHAIDVLVTKNSGSQAMQTKLSAARALGISVVMIEQPACAPADRLFIRPQAVLAALDAHQYAAGHTRGV